MEASLSFVVAGAGGYLGSAFVRYLASIPGSMIIATTRSTAAHRVESDQITYCESIDLTRAEDLERLASVARDRFQERFHVINAAGLFLGYKAICDTELRETADIFSSNVMSTFGLATVLIPIMIARGGGHFITFSSHTAEQSYPLMAAFSASKVAVDSVVRSIANEYAKHGVVANSVAVATLASEEERTLKPFGDHAAWLQDRQVVEFVFDLTQSRAAALNGNTLHLFNYSKSFFDQSYFDRIRAGKVSHER